MTTFSATWKGKPPKGFCIDNKAIALPAKVRELLVSKTPTFPQRFGIHLKNYRLSLGLTQEVMAERLGLCSRTMLSRYERGKSEALLSTIYLWAKRLGVDPSVLLPPPNAE